MEQLVIGLFGFGKTGSIVAQEIIKDESLKLSWVIRKSAAFEGEHASRLLGFNHDEGIIYSAQHIDYETFYEMNKVDVIIDFSDSCSVTEYQNAVKYGTRIVSAISNYDDTNFEQLKTISEETAVLYSPNITLGINFLIEASKLFKKVVPNADIEIIEEHFKEKKSVSGTAIRIAQDLGISSEEHVKSIRTGGVVGTHEVIFGLPNQIIRIKHESLSRAAFGQGAIYAAKWVMNQEKGMYRMEEAISSLMKQANAISC
jgi:4-hydroxy-tetrahydrodipicolinate reductase